MRCLLSHLNSVSIKPLLVWMRNGTEKYGFYMHANSEGACIVEITFRATVVVYFYDRSDIACIGIYDR